MPAKSEINPSDISTVSLAPTLPSKPEAAKPLVPSREALAVEVKVNVNLLALVRMTEEKSLAEKLTLALVLLSPSISQLIFEKSICALTSAPVLASIVSNLVPFKTIVPATLS